MPIERKGVSWKSAHVNVRKVSNVSSASVRRVLKVLNAQELKVHAVLNANAFKASNVLLASVLKVCRDRNVRARISERRGMVHRGRVHARKAK